MEQFLHDFSLFLYGVAIGYFLHPIVNIIKKIIHEARTAKAEWRKSSEK